jgi:hypothetical protein
MFLYQAKLGAFAAIGVLLLSPPAFAHRMKASAAAKSARADAASYWEARALGYFRALAKTHRELVELERKCGKTFPILPNYGALPLEGKDSRP